MIWIGEPWCPVQELAGMIDAKMIGFIDAMEP